MNFKDFSEQCLARFYANAVPKSSDCAHRIFEQRVYPLFGNMDLADIRKSQIMAAAEQWQEWSTYYTRRILQLLVRMFDYAEIMELVDRNPADRVLNFARPHKTRGYNFVGPRDLPTPPRAGFLLTRTYGWCTFRYRVNKWLSEPSALLGFFVSAG